MIHSGNWFKSNIYLVVHNNFVLAPDSCYCKWDGGTTLTVMISIFKLTEDHQSGFTECQTYFLSFLLHHLSQPLRHGEKKIDFDFSHFTLVTSHIHGFSISVCNVMWHVAHEKEKIATFSEISVQLISIESLDIREITNSD